MEKLTNQSPLFDITKRINEIVDELNNNKDVYLSFKPDIGKSLTKTYKYTDLPISYDVEAIGVYKIELTTENSVLPYELSIKGQSTEGKLFKANNIVDNIFLYKGDKIVFKEKALAEGDILTVSYQMNILESFIKEYNSVQNNISIVSEISEENKKQMAAIRETIKDFYNVQNFEPVSQEELLQLLGSLGE